MKTFVTLLTILLAMVFVVPAFAGEEPYKAAVCTDNKIPPFYISPKIAQFTHPETCYYSTCLDVLPFGDPRIQVPPCVPVPGAGYYCPSICREKFTSKTAVNQPEVCCTPTTVAQGKCPGQIAPGGYVPDSNSLTPGGNGGWYTWVIALPKKPEGELNIEIECGVLKPDTFEDDFSAILDCAAITGEPVATNCTRKSGGVLNPAALPTIEVTAHPGCRNDFTPFHLTAYKNPGSYQIPAGPLTNTAALQVLDGTWRSRIALKSCMDKTVLVKWPIAGTLNAYDSDQNPNNGLQPEEEADIDAGDFIKVRILIPKANTVDIYCSQWSVKIGGIGNPRTILSDNPSDCPCIMNANCTL